MDTAQDPIKTLIETTGLSCEDLLEKLLQYKRLQNKIAVHNTLPEKLDENAAEKERYSGHPDEVEPIADVVDFDQGLESNSKAAVIINESDHHRGPKVLEESNVSSETVDSGERLTIITERKEEIRSADLKTISTENEDKIILTETIDIFKNQKDITEKSENIESSDIVSDDERKSSNESLLPNLNVSFDQRNSPNNCGDLLEIKQNDKSGGNNESISFKNSKNEKEICSKNQRELNLTSKSANSDTSYAISTDISKSILRRKKSISDELVQKLSERIKQCEEKSNSEGMSEENDIEVCQIEDSENLPKPLLKLRSDLFANNSKCNFTPSDNEDEDNSEIREFLKNIVEVTGEVQNHPPTNPTVQTCKETIIIPAPRVRKVKSGFVKKRILNKAIKCMNAVETKKIENMMRENKFLEPENAFCEKENAEEEIRENLKLQLSCLRNRKKDNMMKEKSKTKGLVMNYGKHTFEKKKVSNKKPGSDDHVEGPIKIKPESHNAFANIIDDSLIEDTNSENNESLFSLSNDTNLVIVDVQGGVEFTDNNEIIEKTVIPPTDLIKLTKTKDVTKIKGWQNKKFQLDEKENLKESNEKIELHSQPDFSLDTSSPSCSKLNSGKGKKSVTEELSPFVSSTLDEFLTENSTLNISYKIPKLGAVQDINKMIFDTVKLPQDTEYTNLKSRRKEERLKSLKPKTLAEKRRMLENRESQVSNEKKTFNKSSYVLYNGQKLYVPSLNSEQCLMNIKYTPNLKVRNEKNSKVGKNKKISLLDSCYQYSNCVSYKPGPLQKKQKLQNKESLLDWNTEIRRLPPIKLNVVMELGKPIPPHLIHYFKFGTKIEQDRLELALSALSNGSGKQKQGFSLTVPYENKQKYVLVRKKRDILRNVLYDITPERNTIGSILDDIITYVENKENENMIIRDAEIYEQEENQEKEVKTSYEVNLVKKAKDRRLKTEIQRLSCKVLSVTLKETEENKLCQKSYCKMGCLCKSLACIPQLPMHCGKIQCMFECECSANGNISLGIETGELTHDTVTRLEDQVKKNLARVEKEFTQTIIHADDKTILIPSSDRSKTKRVKRMPKRYSDFLEDFDDKVLSSNDIGENISNKISNCFVSLQKLNVKGIIPLCLYHDCYNCSCMDDNTDKIAYSTPGNESQEVMPHKNDKKKKHSPEKKITKFKESKILSEVSSPGHNTSDSDHFMEDNKVFKNRKVKVKEGCARHIGVHPEIVARNQIPFYRSKIKCKVIQAENSTFIDPTTLQDVSYSEPLTKFIDIITPLAISASDRLKLSILKSKTHKRKQTFDDVDRKYIPKKLKLSKFHQESINEPCDINNKIEGLPYAPVFEGEIIVPTNENEEFVRKLGMKSAAQYMRLLPWNDLLINYYNDKINIWCNDGHNKLLMNTRNIEPPKGYIEITESNRKNGIMNWILTKRLPKRTPSELVHLILSPKNKYFEISGICLKNITEEERAGKIISTKKNDRMSESSMIVDHNCQLNISDVFEHKNHNNETKILIMTQGEYNDQFLCVQSPSEELNNEQLAPLQVRLPRFEFLRWRMLFLNSNFTFLSFEKSQYSIKYTDLMNVLKKAQNSNKTICLQSKYLSKGYTQKNFGIYAVPKFVDILFIGPYEMNEEHSLQTLRYLRQELVSTSYFELIQGGVIPNKKKDMWLITKHFTNDLNEVSSDVNRKSPSNLMNLSHENLKQEVINSEYAVLTPLPNSNTSLSSDENNSDLELKSDTAQELHNFHSHLFYTSGNLTTSADLDEKAFVKFPQFMILNGKTLRSQDYNGYLTTNIPGFGYLGAIIDHETKETEVNWPFGNKVLRFSNILYAKQFIKRRFANLLLPVPATFNLQIFMKNDVAHLNDISPVDSKFLNGTHICGSFGVLDSRKLTPSLALTLGTTQEDVLQRLAKRAQFLGNLEIEKLRAQEKVLMNTKKELIVKKQRNLKKYMELLMNLPEEQRLDRYAKFRQEFNADNPNHSELNLKSEISNKSEKVVECIEIDDSDSADDQSMEIEKAIKLCENPPKEQKTHSIPESRISPQTSPATCTEIESFEAVENFKLVKTPTGKMVLMKDKSGASLSKTLTGIKMKITNNRVIIDNDNT